MDVTGSAMWGLGRDRFDALKSSDNLPSPSGVALRLMELTSDADAPVSEIIALLNTDPASIGRLLKMANSAVYGRPRPAVAVTPDVLLSIGIRALRQVVLAFSLLANHRQGNCREFDYEGFWAHSLVRALVCQRLASQINVIPAAELFTFGLLARIGELGLASLFSLEYSEVLKVRADLPGRIDLEQKTFGFTSPMLSAAMLADWGMPALFTSVLLPREPGPVTANPRAVRIRDSLELAEGLAATLLGSTDKNAVTDGLAALLPVASALGLDNEKLVALSQDMHEDWATWSKTFELAVRPFNVITSSDLANAATVTAKVMSVLVVADEGGEREFLEEQLLASGYTVLFAVNGPECVRVIQESAPDMLIVDATMSAADGLTLVATLRNTQACECMYIVMLTHPKDKDQSLKAVEAGADDFLIKPVESAALQARLSSGKHTLLTRCNLTAERDRLRSDIEQLSAFHLEALEAALTDQLTGLYNRRHAIRRLTELWSQSNRVGRHLSVIVMDIDHFKQVNDRYGHATGDGVLKHFAQILRNHSRLPDLVCRIGGEEFLLILPDTTLDGARQHADRIRKACESICMEIGGATISITASFGVAEKTLDLPGYEELLDAADQALLTAKRQGRNQVVAWGPSCGPSPS